MAINETRPSDKSQQYESRPRVSRQLSFQENHFCRTLAHGWGKPAIERLKVSVLCQNWKQAATDICRIEKLRILLRTRMFLKKYFSVIRQALKGEEHDYTTGDISEAVILLAIPMILELSLESI